jgi:hypothetical protein
MALGLRGDTPPENTATKSNFTSRDAFGTPDPVMRTLTKFLSALVLSLWLAGCATSTITNLTPSTLPRNASGEYMLEMVIDHKQQALREASVTPYVVIGFDTYKMTATPRIPGRWEAYVKVRADQNVLNYYYKVQYEYNQFGKTPGQGTRLSSEFKLTISDK